ncbi:MAG: Uma2 family endonuclease [Myxococcales bacterium]|nr:Uma2 family endonuclease [Myxococcales bacterium]
MANAARKRATYEDLLALPENVVGEIIGGELFAQPRPAIPHAVAASHLGAELVGPFNRGKGGPGGWVILDEPELHLQGGNVLVPDLAGWRRERMPQIPELPAIELPPDWVCEVLSPSTEAKDRVDKMAVYRREGCQHVWLVQPASMTLEVYRLDGETYRLVNTWKGDAQIRAEPFDAVALDLGALWAR